MNKLFEDLANTFITSYLLQHQNEGGYDYVLLQSRFQDLSRKYEVHLDLDGFYRTTPPYVVTKEPIKGFLVNKLLKIIYRILIFDIEKYNNLPGITTVVTDVNEVLYNHKSERRFIIRKTGKILEIFPPLSAVEGPLHL